MRKGGRPGRRDGRCDGLTGCVLEQLPDTHVTAEEVAWKTHGGRGQPSPVREGSVADRTEGLGAAGTPERVSPAVTGGGARCAEHSILREHPPQWHLPWAPHDLRATGHCSGDCRLGGEGVLFPTALSPGAWGRTWGPRHSPRPVLATAGASQSELSPGPDSATEKG